MNLNDCPFYWRVEEGDICCMGTTDTECLGMECDYFQFLIGEKEKTMDDLITVCNKFETIQKTRRELIKLGREHECWLKTDEELANG